MSLPRARSRREAPRKASTQRQAVGVADSEAAAGSPAAAVREGAGTAAAGVPRRRSGRRAGRGRQGKGGKAGTPQTQQAREASSAAPRNRRRRRRTAAPRSAPDIRIGVGVVVLRGDEILLVRERGRWSLPKGGLDGGELLQEGARRECQEETGLDVEIGELAFVVEFHARSWGHHLQFFYAAREIGGVLGPKDPDREVQEARFVPILQLREYMRFRPRLLALEAWLQEKRPQQLVFNLDAEPAMLRRDQMLPYAPDEPLGARR